MNEDASNATKQAREGLIRDEIKHRREEFMLEQARAIVMKEGLSALSLPRLAEVSHYSKPTVYKYFPTREDLIVALAAGSAAIRASYYEKAITFEARPREKIIAIHSLNIGALSGYFSDMLNVHLNRLSARATEGRRKLLLNNEIEIEKIHARIVREAVENGDLTLPPGLNEYQIILTLTATTFGALMMKESDSPVVERWLKGTGFAESDFVTVVMDGFGWRPLSNEWEYSRTVDRFYDEVFPELKTRRLDRGLASNEQEAV